MSTDLSLFQQNGGLAQVPTALHSVMGAMAASEMQANVGASYAVVTIKGKVFSIKYGGQTTPVTIDMNGQLYAAPYFDVVIPKARAELSKTYYPTGYQDGSDEAPTCWSEDGINPLAPLEQRPIDPRTGQACADCRACPMNAFGSKSGDGKGKACADTRKLLVVPIDQRTNQMDGENAKFGGPMLLRVPAASLRAFAEYDAKLQSMGVPYFAVVTRLEFDPAQAYPKFVLKPVRVLTEAEATKVVEIRDSMQAKQILESGQTGAPPAPALPKPNGVDTSGIAGQQIPAQLVQQQPAAPVVPQQPVQAAAPAPTPAPAPVAPPPPVAPPAPVAAFPPDGWQAHPQSAGWFYKGQEVLSEADLRARYAAPAAPPAPQAPPLPPAPTVTAVAPAQPVQAAPVQVPPGQAAAGPQATPALLNAVDSLLAGS